MTDSKHITGLDAEGEVGLSKFDNALGFLDISEEMSDLVALKP